jgi:hypothetical protein
MSVTIDGSGTITGISAGGLPDGSITNDDLAGSITDAKLSGTTCKAFVNFDGTGTPAIRAQFNVSSITDNGTGDYTVNFTTALVDANYSVVMEKGVTGTRRTIASYGVDGSGNSVTPTTTAVRVACFDESATAAIDMAGVSVAIFR